MEGLEGLIGESTWAIIVAVVVTLNIAVSAVVSILQAWGKSLPQDSLFGKILKAIQTALDWLSANVAHKKKDDSKDS